MVGHRSHGAMGCREGPKAIVKLLLDKGVTSSLKNNEYDRTPLCLERSRGSSEVLLLDKGADVKSKDKYGETPLS
jgi:ankyrin repeat protein